MHSATMSLLLDWAPLLAIIALGAAYIVALWIWAATTRYRQYYAALEALSKQFQGGLSRWRRYLLLEPCFVGMYLGCEFSVAYFLRRHGSTLYGPKVTCSFRSPGKLRVLMYDRNQYCVLFARRVEVRDHDLAKYFIYSNMPDEARRYLSDTSRREAIRELVASGWGPPTIGRRSVSVSAAGGPPTPSLDPGLVEATLRNLVALRAEAPSA